MALALIIVAIIVARNVIYNVLFDNEKQNEKMVTSYEAEKERHEKIREIPDNSIEEGKGIKIKTFSKIEGIEYKIYNSGEKIIFYYQIDDINNFDNSNLACATITLSNDFEILDKEYSELQDFEEYKQHTKKLWEIYSLLIVAMGLFIAMVIYKVFQDIYSLYKELKKSKKQTNTNS